MSEEQKSQPAFSQKPASPSVPATQAARPIEPQVLPPEGEEKATGWTRIFWIFICVVCVIYIIIPNLPIPFFLDEGLMAMVLVYALDRIGIRIPILTWFIHRRLGKTTKTK